ncbi:hypothetical protein [Leisingera sp. ANG-S]|uniref:hypothetical protein n=1 Tax=Leisingera sp. ANG-S TaxID=1577898 RepID=UPI00126A12F1|nr:hypothetical protein [Leisingera sp. ANG-S]
MNTPPAAFPSCRGKRGIRGRGENESLTFTKTLEIRYSILLKSLFLLTFLLHPTLSFAANWHSYGTCSYLIDQDGDEAFQLVSQSACRQDFYGGTGYWLSVFEWENGNIVKVVFNIEESGEQNWQLNGRTVLIPNVEFNQNESQASFGTCHVTKAPKGFEATCFKRLGEQTQGH